MARHCNELQTRKKWLVWLTRGTFCKYFFLDWKMLTYLFPSWTLTLSIIINLVSWFIIISLYQQFALYLWNRQLRFTFTLPDFYTDFFSIQVPSVFRRPIRGIIKLRFCGRAWFTHSTVLQNWLHIRLTFYWISYSGNNCYYTIRSNLYRI